MQHLVIVRTGANVLDLDTYNCQELGLAKALTAKGLKVTLVMAGNDHKEAVFPCDGGEVRVIFLRFKSINQRYGFFLGINKTLAELSPDLLQVHDLGIFMTWYVTRWAKKHSIPCFLIQGTYQISPRPGIKQIEKLYYSTLGKNTLRDVSGIGCKSLMASRFIKSFLNKETQLTYIGLDEGKFKTPTEIDWKKELRLQDKHVLLYVGILEERRKPNFLLDIMQFLPDDYVLLLVGKGPQWEEIHARVIKDKLQDKVHLLGKLGQEQLPSLYKIADLFLLASEYEIFGMIILESMYFGLPVISSYSAGVETIITQEEDGVIIDEFDAKKWGNVIISLCDNEELLQNMKGKACKKIQNVFVWKKAADSFLRLYNN